MENEGAVEKYSGSIKKTTDMVPYYEAKDIDSDRIVRGFYFAYPEITYCFTEDYERHPVKIIHCIAYWKMSDWSLPNRPMLCTIDVKTLKRIGWIVNPTKMYQSTEPWYEK